MYGMVVHGMTVYGMVVYGMIVYGMIVYSMRTVMAGVARICCALLFASRCFVLLCFFRPACCVSASCWLSCSAKATVPLRKRLIASWLVARWLVAHWVVVQWLCRCSLAHRPLSLCSLAHHSSGHWLIAAHWLNARRACCQLAHCSFWSLVVGSFHLGSYAHCSLARCSVHWFFAHGLVLLLANWTYWPIAHCSLPHCSLAHCLLTHCSFGSLFIGSLPIGSSLIGSLPIGCLVMGVAGWGRRGWTGGVARRREGWRCQAGGCGVWCVVCGVWCVVCGAWCVFCSAGRPTCGSCVLYCRVFLSEFDVLFCCYERR